MVRPRLLLAPLIVSALAANASAAEDPASETQSQLSPAVPNGSPSHDPSQYEGHLVSAIIIEGNKKTREDVIRREIETEVGAPLDTTLLSADLVRLSNTQLFASTEIEARAGEDGGVILTFTVSENPSVLPFPAVAYTEADGFSFGAGILFSNLRGKAHSLAATALFGGARQGAIAFSNPWWMGNRVSFAMNLGRTRREDTVREFNELSDQATVSVGSWLGRAGRLKGSVNVFRMQADVDGQTLSPDDDDLLVSVAGAIGLDTRDNWRAPHRGWHNEVSVTRTGGLLGGQGDFWTLVLDLRRYQPIAPRHTIAAGVLVSRRTGEVGADIPPFMQYHLGGTNTIRGFKLDELGRELYGKSELIATAEYRFTFVPPRRFDIWRWPVNLGFQLAGFVDTGTAWSEPSELSFDRFYTGTGLGLRLLVPGSEMVRFDVGYSRRGGWQFHFSALSKFDAQRDRVR